MNQNSASKWTFGHVVLFLVGVIALIGVSTFLAMTLTQHYREPSQLWAMATDMFTLFGILLGVGVAFALLAVAVSLLALNQKLYESQNYLAQARLHLDEYKQLTHQEKLVQEKVHKLIDLHQNLPDTAPYGLEVETIFSLVKPILSSEFADFEARLVARAVQQDIQAKQMIHYAQNQPSLQVWGDVVQQFETVSRLWHVLLSAGTDGLYDYFQYHYLTAKLYQATATQHFAIFNGTAQQPEHYRQLNHLYAPFLALSGKTKNTSVNQLINQAAYQNAMLSFQEGEILWQKHQDMAEVGQKWQQAKQYFQAASLAQPNDAETPYQYGSLLEREARLMAQTDADKLPQARQLWLQAREQYCLALDIQPKKAEAAFNWGNTLADEATALVQTDADTLPEARVLWHNAREKFKQTLMIDANFDSAAYHAGMVFNKEADATLQLNQNTDDACGLWKQAGEQFQAALSINSMRFDAANSWGLVLAKEADLLFRLDSQNLSEAQRLWQLAQQRFHLALEIEPNLSAAAANWRTVLMNESALLSNTEKLSLWKNAHDKIAALRQMSLNHAGSLSISELAETISQQLHQQESIMQPQPVAQLRSTIASE